MILYVLALLSILMMVNDQNVRDRTNPHLLNAMQVTEDLPVERSPQQITNDLQISREDLLKI